MDQSMSHIPDAAVQSQPKKNNRPDSEDHIVPPSVVADVNTRILNYIRGESRLAIAAQQSAAAQPTSDNSENLEAHQRGYRQSLGGLLADSLKGLSFCEHQNTTSNDDDNSSSSKKNTNNDEDSCTYSSHTEDKDKGREVITDGENDQDLPGNPDTPIEDNASESTTEPFPDYFESCENDPPVVDNQHEKAYNYAISKVVEEVIRFREVDARITTPSFAPHHSFDDSQQTLEVINEDQEFYGEDEDDNMNEPFPQSPVGERVPNEPHQNRILDARFFIDSSELDKHRVIEEMRRLLTSARLKDPPKDCFYDMSDMVIEMEAIIFRNKSVAPHEFLSAEDTYDIGLVASAVTRYLAVVDRRLQELLYVGPRVHCILADVFRDTSVNVFLRYRRIAHVVFGNSLLKATEPEKNILITFLDLYDTFVYTSFLNMRNRQLLLEEVVDVGRNEVSRLLIALWDILCRVIENYDRYLTLMTRIGSEYLNPIMEEVERALVPYHGSGWEQYMKMQLETGMNRYTDGDLSVLRPEGA